MPTCRPRDRSIMVIVRVEMPAVGTENVNRGRAERRTFRVPLRGDVDSTDGTTGRTLGAGVATGVGDGAGQAAESGGGVGVATGVGVGAGVGVGVVPAPGVGVGP